MSLDAGQLLGITAVSKSSRIQTKTCYAEVVMPFIMSQNLLVY